MSCGHTICATCVTIFGQQSTSEQYLYRLAECGLCQKEFTSDRTAWSEIQLKPAEAGPRILAIDGGGVRGTVSARILDLLEQEINLDLPISYFFDLIIGTSSGESR
jgi:hypothetical protein